MQRTFEISVDGDTNLLSALKAAGWTGYGRLATANFYSDDAVTVYINLTDSANVPPVDGTKGFSIGSAAPSLSYTIEPSNTPFDAARTWLHSGSPVVIKVLVIGG